jgi:hypothetical protein
MIIVIKHRHLPHHFNTAVAKNFPGYEYAICKNVGRTAPKIGLKFLTRGGRGVSSPELLTSSPEPYSSTPLRLSRYSAKKNKPTYTNVLMYQTKK